MYCLELWKIHSNGRKAAAGVQQSRAGRLVWWGDDALLGETETRVRVIDVWK